jgi:hypothetical protein
VDSVVADFSKISTVQIKIGIVQTKIGIIHPKFSEKIGFGQVRFFATRGIFKHCLRGIMTVDALSMASPIPVTSFRIRLVSL